MLKFKNPESVQKMLTATVLTIGLVAPVFGNTEANYSFGGDGGGGGAKCYEQVFKDCQSGGFAFVFTPTQNGGGISLQIPVVNGQWIKCKRKRNGSKTCTTTNCAGTTLSITSTATCQ